MSCQRRHWFWRACAVLAALAALLHGFAGAIEASGASPSGERGQEREQGWGILTTPRFRIIHTRKAHGAARALAANIERTRERFCVLLGRDWSGVTEIRIGVGRAELEAMAPPGNAPPAWATAAAYPRENVVLLDALTLSGAEGETTLRHELSHVALGQLAERWPRWFQEGMAMYLTGDRYSSSQYTTLFGALKQDRVFHFEDLSDHWPEDPLDVSIAYAQSVSFVAFLTQHHSPVELHLLLEWVAKGDAFETAFAKAFRASLNTEEQGWKRQLAARYSWVPILTAASVEWAVLAMICVVAFVRRRRQRARRLAEMDEAEDETIFADWDDARTGDGPLQEGAAPKPESSTLL